MTITHSKVSAKTDGADSSLVQPSDWNAGHTIATGYALVRVATVTLTDAQIKALPTTPITVLAAPGANKIVFPLAAWYRLEWHADYSDINGACALHLKVGTSEVLIPIDNSLGFMTVNNLLADGESASAWVGSYHGTDIVSGNPYGVSGYTDGDIVNKSILFSATNGGSDFTGGHASNTLKVTVYYMIVDL